MLNPFEHIENRLDKIESLLLEVLNRDKSNVDNSIDNSNEFLTSIAEIAEFLKIGKTKAQTIKNDNYKIFIQDGRRFWVKKNDLLNAIKKNNVFK